MAVIDTNYNGTTNLKDFWPKTKSNFENLHAEQEGIKSGSITVGKALKDGNGNVISDTYATKTELTSEATTRQNADNALTSQLNAHKNDTNNPHQVTKQQIGLGNVDNTSDLNKPISTATQAALNTKADYNYVNNKFDELGELAISLVNNMINNLAGEGRTTETIKGNYDLIQALGLQINQLTDKLPVSNFFARGKNLFNKDTAIEGYYVNQITGELGENAGHTVSDFILIEPNTSYICNFGHREAYYDATKTFISGSFLTTGESSTSPPDAKYMRVSFEHALKSADEFQLEKGTEITYYEAYKEYIPKTVLEVDEFETKLALKSIKSNPTPTFLTAGYRMYVAPYSTFKGWAYPFTEEHLPIKYISFNVCFAEGVTNVPVRLVIMDAAKNVLFTLKDVAAGTGWVDFDISEYDIEFPEQFFLGITTDDSTLMFHPSCVLNPDYNGVTALYTVNNGLTWAETTVEGHPMPIKISSIAPRYGIDEQLVASINLPASIPVVIGHEINIYFDNIVDKAERYDFDVVCTKGKQENERWTYTPGGGDAGTYPLTINVYKDYKLVATATTNIIVKADTVGNGVTRKCIFIGDSTTDAGVYPTELLNLFDNDVMNVTLLGTRGESPALHEGRGGWSAKTYTTSASQAGVVNAFWNPEESKFDFSYYMTQQGYEDVDYVCLHLGINDIFNATNDDDAYYYIFSALNSLDIMIDSIKDFSENVTNTIKIGMMVTIPPSKNQDAFGSYYGSNQTRWRYKRTYDMWVKEFLQRYSSREDENIYIIPLNVNLDTVNNMPTSQVAINSRNSTLVTRQNNSVHPANSGYYQMADVIYYWLKCQES